MSSIKPQERLGHCVRRIRLAQLSSNGIVVKKIENFREDVASSWRATGIDIRQFVTGEASNMTTKYSTEALSLKIKDALVTSFGIDPSLIVAEATMRDLGVDSLHVVEILIDLEAELGVKLTDLSFPPNPTLNDVAQTIEKNLAAIAKA